jgi:hypothetical protein
MTGDVDIAAWLAERPMVPEMDVAAFVADARGLGREADTPLRHALGARSEATAATALAALRAKGFDVYRHRTGGLAMRMQDAPSNSTLRERTRPEWTFEGLAAPMSDRPNEAMRPSYEMGSMDLIMSVRNLRAKRRKARDERRRSRTAMATLKAQAYGRSPAEIEGRINEIWEEHGLPVPPAFIQPLLADRAARPGSRLTELRESADLMSGGVRWVSQIVRVLRHPERLNAGVSVPGPTETLVIPGDDWIEVAVDVDARHRLAVMSTTAPGFASRTLTKTLVHLRRGDGETVEVWERTPDMATSAQRLGVVPYPTASTYLAELEAAAQTGRSVACMAMRIAASKDSWRLYLRVPHLEVTKNDLGGP